MDDIIVSFKQRGAIVYHFLKKKWYAQEHFIYYIKL